MNDLVRFTCRILCNPKCSCWCFFFNEQIAFLVLYNLEVFDQALFSQALAAWKPNSFSAYPSLLKLVTNRQPNIMFFQNSNINSAKLLWQIQYTTCRIHLICIWLIIIYLLWDATMFQGIGVIMCGICYIVFLSFYII